MKIKSIAAVGAMGVGLGVAGFLGAGTASAAPVPPTCGDSPTGATIGNIICNVQSQTGTFAESISPQYNLGVLLNGNADNPDLGLLDQPSTFARSLQNFASGPQSPGGPSPVDNTPPGQAP